MDIFAGLGTSLFVAEELGRIPFGIEYDQKRFEYIRSKTRGKENIIHGDARKLDSYDFPKMDFAITSPPYMHKNDPENPLTAYTEEGNYQQYLVELREIFSQLKIILKSNAFLVIEVSNLKGKEVTTLAWDIANEIFRAGEMKILPMDICDCLLGVQSLLYTNGMVKLAEIVELTRKNLSVDHIADGSDIVTIRRQFHTYIETEDWLNSVP